MVIALNWHHIRIRFAPQLSSRIVDGPRTVAYCSRPFLRRTSVNERDAIVIQSIRPRHLSNQVEIGDQLTDHLPMLVLMVLGITLAQNSFVIAEIIPV